MEIKSIKAKTCVQCERWFYYRRSTKITCSPSCRKQHSRGVEPTPRNRYGLTDREQIAAIIADTNPKAWKQLTNLQEFHGSRAVNFALDLLLALE